MYSQELIPRAYQDEIFQEACKANIICASPTGSGKTFIAVLLIRWITGLEKQDGRKVIFIVPKVPLVNQQAGVLERLTPLRVKGYCGEMGVDLWDLAQWQKEFAEHDVLVMTAQILYNLFTHAHWAMSKISLLIFDEVHHCRKNSPYNRIMQDYYRTCPSKSRPKIFGMTASPIYNPSKAQAALAELEANTFSKVLSVRGDRAKLELAENSPKPTEDLKVYPRSPKSYFDYTSLWDDVMNAKLWNTRGLNLSEVETKYTVAFDALGPLGADHYLFSYLERRVNEIQNTHVGIALNLMAVANGSAQPPSAPAKGLQEVQRLLEVYRPIFGVAIPTINISWLSPKVLTLAELLLSVQSESFQGIVFVEQRHVTTALSWLLSGISALNEWLKCAPFVGHGTNSSSNIEALGSRGMTFKLQNDVVKSFRDSEFNLLIATSVAEEGLDFQACHMIVRFDGLKTMVGYVQSRGRARRPDSTYVVMIEEKANIELDKYYQLKHSERALDKMYQRAEGTWIAEEADSDEEDMDVDASEQYKVPSTGATLTSHSAIALLNYLCSIIPRDDFCPTIKAEYDVSGSAQGFIASVKLPSVLPIPRNQREHRGCVCGSRKAAKRSAAFTAARTLHMLGVFDDNLLPGRLQRGDGAQDADGKPISNTFDIPKVMEVPVRFPWPDPWRAFAEVWLHPVYVNGRASTGLVAGCSLETLQCVFETPEGPRKVSLGAGVRLQWPTEEARLSQLRVMEAYSISTIWWTISIGTMPSNHSYYLVPINGNSPDYRKMMAFMEDNSSLDWSSIDAQHEDALVVMDRTKNGQAIFLFKKLRTDLSPLSKPIPINGVCIEEDFESYLAYHTHKMRKMKHPIDIDPNEPILELEHLPRARNMSSALDRLLMDTVKNIQEDPKPDSVLLPRSLCRWIRIPIEIFRIMQMVPSLIRLITDISRARACRVNLNLPSVPDNLIVQALTLPSAMTGYSYQRLETLGDAVLKLATSVHIFNKFPHRHEGQLDILRMNSINNIYLLARARDHHLEEYLNTEPITIKHWKPFTGNDVLYNDNGDVFVQRKFARRSLPDCVEALLGASFLSGGMTSALATGTTLELCVGGPEPWQIRYKTDADEVTLRQTRVLFASLEEAIGYQFRNPRLLVEAVSHPSFHSPETPSYQRLEFLGDALLDLYVTDYLFNEYPQASPGGITWAKSRAVCNQSLAAVSSKDLMLYKYALYTSPALGSALVEANEMFEKLTYKDVVRAAWKLDPPKILADLLEALMGAVLVDSGYDLGRAFEVVGTAMKDLMAVIYVGMPRDPISELMIFVARAGCGKVKFRKSKSSPELVANDMVSVYIHGVDFAGAFKGPTMSLSKYMVAERALEMLQVPLDTHPYKLCNLCNCQREKEKELAAAEAQSPPDTTKELPNETEEEFKRSADSLLAVSDGQGSTQSHEEKGDGDVEMVATGPPSNRVN